jgi:mercuric ion binding protein
MKTLIAAIFITLSLGNLYASGVEKTVKVKGMVCAFCAQGIEKKFKAQNEVQDVDVNLEKHYVKLVFKPEQSLTDEKIATLLKDAGYSVEQ